MREVSDLTLLAVFLSDSFSLPSCFSNRNFHLFSCKKLVTARKQMSILQAPKILVIQLKVSVSCFCLQKVGVILDVIFLMCFLLNWFDRGLMVFLVGRLIKPLHLERFWFSRAS